MAADETGRTDGQWLLEFSDDLDRFLIESVIDGKIQISAEVARKLAVRLREIGQNLVERS